jgi:thiol-disulfide isomerase/thioredoxin
MIGKRFKYLLLFSLLIVIILTIKGVELEVGDINKVCLTDCYVNDTIRDYSNRFNNRNLVLLEIGTATWCVFCPGAAMGADDLVANGYPVAVVEYHKDDPFDNLFAEKRIQFYGITGFPTAVFDGLKKIEEGSANESMFEKYKNVVEAEITEPTCFSLELNVIPMKNHLFKVIIKATEEYDYGTDNLSVFLALTESDISYHWFGLNNVNYVCREMYPGYNGQPVNFELNEPVILEYNIDVSYLLSKCELVAWIQDLSSKEVLQTVKVNMLQAFGVKKYNEYSVNVYPNPASSLLHINSEFVVKSVVFYNLYGQVVYKPIIKMNNRVSFDIDFLNDGIYLIEIKTGNFTFYKEVSIQH